MLNQINNFVKGFQNINAIQDRLDMNNVYRVLEQSRQYDYYIGNRDTLREYLGKALKKTWDSSTVSQMQKSLLNITKRFINQLAVIYKEPAHRSIYVNGKKNAKLTEYYQNILPLDINKIDKFTHRLAKLQNTVLPYIYFDDKTGRFKQKTNSSAVYDVIADDFDTLLPKQISYSKYFGDKLYTVIYTENEIYMIDSDNDTKTPLPGNNSTNNIYGVLPYVVFRLIDENDFWGEGQNLLIDENEIINVLLTKLNYDDIILGTAGALFGVNLGELVSNQDASPEDATRSVKAGRGNILNIETNGLSDRVPPSLKYISTNPQIVAVTNAIDFKIRALANAFGLNPNSVSSDVKVESGFSRTISLHEQSELRKDDLDACLKYEQDRFLLIKKMNNVLVQSNYSGTEKLIVIPDEAQLMVDFPPLESTLSQSDLWFDRKEREARGMGTPLQWLIEDNIDIKSEKIAQEILDANLEYLKNNPIASNSITNQDKELYKAKYEKRNLEKDTEVKKLNATT